MPEAVIFDVDGTLVDSSYQHALAWQQACLEMGIEETTAVLHHLVGMGKDQFVNALVGHEFPELVSAHSRAMKKWESTIRPLPGARQIIEALHGLGRRIAVASSGERQSVRSELALVLSDHTIVDPCITGDDVGSTKPAPDVVQVALDRLGLPPSEVVLVGDTGWDAQAATRCGVRCVGVMTGGWSEEALTDAGAVAVYPTLTALLEDLPASPLAAA